MIVVIQRLFTGADSTALIAIPLFILAGGLMVQGGISNRIVSFADALIGHFPSGLALVSILACMFFAAITGSAIAATAARPRNPKSILRMFTSRSAGVRRCPRAYSPAAA